MDDKKLAFETAMTQAASVARENMSPDKYNQFQTLFARAWAAYDGAVDGAIDEAVREVKSQSQPKDKRWSLSVTLGLRKEG